LFAEALDGFVDVNGELIIEMFEHRASDIFDSEKQQSITAAIDRAELVKFVSGETRRKF